VPPVRVERLFGATHVLVLAGHLFGGRHGAGIGEQVCGASAVAAATGRGGS
jgi:hypothetical protein